MNEKSTINRFEPSTQFIKTMVYKDVYAKKKTFLKNIFKKL